jgi:hypothetical protein
VKIENGIKFNFETLKMKINGFSDLLISFLFKIQILNENKKLISFSNLFFDFFSSKFKFDPFSMNQKNRSESV